MEHSKLSSEHQNNLSHFMAMAYVAQIDGKLKKKEIALLKGFAIELGIEPNEYEQILQKPYRPIIRSSNSTTKRLKRIFSMFKIVFANHKMDRNERFFIYRYALQIGFSKSNARKVIRKSSAMFTGEFDFNAYDSFVKG